MRWLQQFEPRTEVPEDTIFGASAERLAPHIYNEREIVELLAAARQLGPAPACAVRSTRHCSGLIASTGLRVSEALALRKADVDLKSGMLTIRRTKFAKSRQVPMHPSTVAALRRYRRLRDLAIADTDSRRSSSAREAAGGDSDSATARCVASSPRCVNSWDGATAERIMPSASTIYGTPSSCVASCSGMPRASTSTRRCCRCRPTWVMRW